MLHLPRWFFWVAAICRALAAADEACQAQQHDTAFVEWLGTRGANFSAVEVFTASDAGRRGVRARRALRQGELAAFVPHGLLLDAAAARASSPFGARFLLPALAHACDALDGQVGLPPEAAVLPSEEGFRLAQKIQVGPGILVRIQL